METSHLPNVNSLLPAPLFLLALGLAWVSNWEQLAKEELWGAKVKGMGWWTPEQGSGCKQ